jgi:hypothetical protein
VVSIAFLTKDKQARLANQCRLGNNRRLASSGAAFLAGCPAELLCDSRTWYDKHPGHYLASLVRFSGSHIMSCDINSIQQPGDHGALNHPHHLEPMIL